MSRSQPLSLAITSDAATVDINFFREDHDANDEDLSQDETFFLRLTTLIHHASRWQSFHINCTSADVMFALLSYLEDLSPPCLTHVSVQLCNGTH